MAQAAHVGVRSEPPTTVFRTRRSKPQLMDKYNLYDLLASWLDMEEELRVQKKKQKLGQKLVDPDDPASSYVQTVKKQRGRDSKRRTVSTTTKGGVDILCEEVPRTGATICYVDCPVNCPFSPTD